MSLPAEEGWTSDESSLVDDFGRQIGGAMGWPRMAGRAAAVLMLSEQPMTLAQLQHELRASKGSVSETTRLLMANGTVARFKQPGTRHFVYQWREDAWIGCLQHQLEATQQLLTLAESAHTRSGGLATTQQERVDEMYEYYRFIVRRLETLLNDYTAQWRDRRSGGST